jgi:hypothetical protein
MNGKMYVFTPGDDQPKMIEIVGPPTLDWLKRHLDGGYLESVPGFDWFVEPGTEVSVRCVAFCDEDGKGKGLPLNVEATTHWFESMGTNLYHLDYLVGPVLVVVGDDEFMDAL